MKHFLFTLTLLFPFAANAAAPLEYDLIRTAETPGFFAITIYPGQNSTPLSEKFIFVKNFEKNQEANYRPVLNFLSEIGANVINTKPLSSTNIQLVSLGDQISEEKNFQANDKNSLEKFEHFAINELQPTFLRNIQAEFGGNISAVTQTENNLSGDNGVTFIGKFEKEMRTRMDITAENNSHTITFQTPLALTDKSLSTSPFAKQLPTLWENMQPKPLINKLNLLEVFPWILGTLGLLILVIIFTRRTKRKYYEFLNEQENLQEELPWQQIKKKEQTPSTPFEIN